jgi:poly[(R)-3-hydroxyalkanoate] polymerase subunit PhaC
VSARVEAPPMGQEGVGIGLPLSLWAERIKELAHGVEGIVDPLGMWAPIQHAQLGWMVHPMELAEAGAASAADMATLYLHGLAKVMRPSIADAVQPQADDQRFADPVWSNDPAWSLMKQWYLFYTRHVQDALFHTPGMSPKERRRAAFWWRQWLNAAAPTNFLATNPVAVRKAVESGGETLRRGLENFLEDVEAGNLRLADPDAFVVGRDLAITPGAVVFRNRLLEVLHYTPTKPRVHTMPIVIVTPWINKFYVLDLKPQKSLVKYLLDQGFDVYITSWKNPDAGMHDMAFDDYITLGVDQAVRVARELSGSDKVHAVGYCIGGTLLTIYMAWLNRKFSREDLPVAHWTLLATLVDFQSPGDIEVFIDEASVRWLSETMRSQGYLDGSAMATTFRLLRSNNLIWHYLSEGWLLGERPPASDVLFWNMDITRMPARMHEFYLREMYLNNNLVKPNALTLAGEPIDLALIHAPLYQVGAEDDHITPWRQTFRISGYVTGEKRFVLTSSGHILGIVNPPVDPPRRHYCVARAHRGEGADAWFQCAERHQGSWWEDWSAWLSERCGPLRKAPPLATRKFPKLADAPGTYVRET